MALAAADLEAAGGVDLVDRVLVPPLHEAAEAGERAGQGERRPDGDVTTAACGRAALLAAAGGEQQACRDAKRDNRRPPSRSTPPRSSSHDLFLHAPTR